MNSTHEAYSPLTRRRSIPRKLGAGALKGAVISGLLIAGVEAGDAVGVLTYSDITQELLGGFAITATSAVAEVIDPDR